MISQAYKVVMDPTVNPLSAMPKMARFRFMVILAYMWSAIFALGIGYAWFFGPSAIVHTLVLVALFFTNDIFKRAKDGRLFE